jgi:hypothetical protein
MLSGGLGRVNGEQVVRVGDERWKIVKSVR